MSKATDNFYLIADGVDQYELINRRTGAVEGRIAIDPDSTTHFADIEWVAKLANQLDHEKDKALAKMAEMVDHRNRVSGLLIEQAARDQQIRRLTSERNEARAAALSDTLQCAVVIDLTRERDEALARVAELEARLQYDPGGSDRIDELEQASLHLRARIAELEAAMENDELTHAASSAELETQVDAHTQQLTDENAVLRARIAELEKQPTVPEGWLVKRDGHDVFVLCRDSYSDPVAYIDKDGWLKSLDGDPLVAPWSALVALEYAYRNNIQPPHATNQHPAVDDLQVKPQTAVDHVVLQGTRRWFKVQVGDQVRYTRSQNQPFYRRDGRLDTGNTTPFKDALFRHFEPQCIEGRRVQFEQVDAALLRRVKGGPTPDVPVDE